MKEICFSGTEVDIWRQTRGIAEELGLNTEHANKKLEDVQEKHEKNLRDYESLAVTFIEIEERLSGIRRNPEKFLKNGVTSH